MQQAADRAEIAATVDATAAGEQLGRRTEDVADPLPGHGRSRVRIREGLDRTEAEDLDDAAPPDHDISATQHHSQHQGLQTFHPPHDSHTDTASRACEQSQ
ncbi:hypothetical protein [Streptomyces sp. NPDC058092]|uniref:hypothetical protein n=1 Tax=Streptomyces sp. NPDC058092 TaxID=3346336 RepID=UPI0036EFB83E